MSDQLLSQYDDPIGNFEDPVLPQMGSAGILVREDKFQTDIENLQNRDKWLGRAEWALENAYALTSGVAYETFAGQAARFVGSAIPNLIDYDRSYDWREMAKEYEGRYPSEIFEKTTSRAAAQRAIEDYDGYRLRQEVLAKHPITHFVSGAIDFALDWETAGAALSLIPGGLAVAAAPGIAAQAVVRTATGTEQALTVGGNILRGAVTAGLQTSLEVGALEATRLATDEYRSFSENSGDLTANAVVAGLLGGLIKGGTMAWSSRGLGLKSPLARRVDPREALSEFSIEMRFDPETGTYAAQPEAFELPPLAEGGKMTMERMEAGVKHGTTIYEQSMQQKVFDNSKPLDAGDLLNTPIPKGTADTYYGAAFIDALHTSAPAQGAASKCPHTRSLMVNMVDSHLVSRNETGELVQGVEFFINRDTSRFQHLTGKILDEEFTACRRDKNPMYRNITQDDFHDMVGAALDKADKSDNPYVQSAAARLRRDVSDPLTKLSDEMDLSGNRAALQQRVESQLRTESEKQVKFQGRAEANSRETLEERIAERNRNYARSFFSRQLEKSPLSSREFSVARDNLLSSAGNGWQARGDTDDLSKFLELSLEQSQRKGLRVNRKIASQTIKKIADINDRINSDKITFQDGISELYKIANDPSKTRRAISDRARHYLNSKQKFTSDNSRRLTELTDLYEARNQELISSVQNLERELLRVQSNQLTPDERGWSMLDESYRHRVYRLDEIRRDSTGFEQAAKEGIMAANEGLTDAQALAYAREVKNKIMGNAYVRVPDNIKMTVGGARGATRERTLLIKSSYIQDYLELDPVVIFSRMSRTIVPDYHVKKRFGSLDMAEQREEIVRWYDTERSEGRMSSLDAENHIQKDLKNLEKVLDRIRNTNAMGADSSWMNSTVQNIAGVGRAISSVTKMGGLATVAIFDISNQVAVNGIANSLLKYIPTGFRRMINAIGGKKMPAIMREDLHAYGVFCDLQKAQTLSRLSLSQMDPGVTPKVARAARRLEQGLGKITLGSYTLEFTRTHSAYCSSLDIARISRKYAAGEKLSKRDINYMNMARIRNEDMLRIADQLEQHGTKDGGYKCANVSNWTDQEAADRFSYGVKIMTDKIILNPGVDMPRVFRGTMGGLAFQFKAYIPTAINRTFMPVVSRLLSGEMLFMLGVISSLYVAGTRSQVDNFLKHGEFLSKEEYFRHCFADADVMVIPHLCKEVADGCMSATGLIDDGRKPYDYIFKPPAFDWLTKATRGGGSLVREKMLGGKPMSRQDRQALKQAIPYNNCYWFNYLIEKMLHLSKNPRAGENYNYGY